MSFAGDQRVLYSCIFLLVVVPMIQIWVCHDCKVGAVRSFPGDPYTTNKVVVVQDQRSNNNNMVNQGKKSREELFNRFFGGRDLNFTSTSQNGFEESKRKVPSCPDPLHN